MSLFTMTDTLIPHDQKASAHVSSQKISYCEKEKKTGEMMG